MSGILLIIRDIWLNYIRHVADIILSAFVIYKLFTLIKGTRSVQVIRGILLLFLATVISRVLDLILISWILKGFWVAGAVALVIVFQPEIRSFLAHLGSGKLTRIIMSGRTEFIDEVITALKNIARKGFGALIVFEQETGLRNFIESGVIMNAEVTAELLETIFTPPSPLHDGAVILSGDRVVAAGCILPLTHNPMMSKVMGTRHRAAVGLSEVSDAIVILVSEETGEFALTREGTLKRGMELDEIKRIMLNYYKTKVVEKSVKMHSNKR